MVKYTIASINLTHTTMKTLLRLTAMIVLLVAMHGNVLSATTFNISTSNNAPPDVTPGQNFKFTIRYSWGGASQGNHEFKATLSLSQTLEIVSATVTSGPGSGPGNGSNVSLAPNSPMFTMNVSSGNLESGSGELTVTVRFKSNVTSGTQGCLSGIISDNYYPLFGGSTVTANGNINSSCVILPSCNCSGVISYQNLAGGSTKSAVAFDFGVVGSINCTDASACIMMVAAKVNQLSPANRQAMENNVCGSTAPNNSPIRAFAKLGTQPYVLVKDVGVLTKILEVSTTTCMCPQGWTSNTSGVAGGVTTDGKCKKKVATMSLTTPPVNSQIGTLVLANDGKEVFTPWGFTEGNDVFVWGTSANGGAKVCTTSIITQGVCKIQ